MSLCSQAAVMQPQPRQRHASDEGESSVHVPMQCTLCTLQCTLHCTPHCMFAPCMHSTLLSPLHCTSLWTAHLHFTFHPYTFFTSNCSAPCSALNCTEQSNCTAPQTALHMSRGCTAHCSAPSNALHTTHLAPMHALYTAVYPARHFTLHCTFYPRTFNCTAPSEH